MSTSPEANPGNRAEDLEVVCTQASKSRVDQAGATPSEIKVSPCFGERARLSEGERSNSDLFSPNF
jgi:hypothetical protein